MHWTWLLVAYFELSLRQGMDNGYEAPVWNVIEYVSLFGIVLIHEFGHALACRQVGGMANQIVLWPLGGIAYVAPPPRPGAVLWSIAAGPLVNVVLVPITAGLWYLSYRSDWTMEFPDVDRYLWSIMIMNGMLLFFNMLPIYPLDGGQIVQALLWFVVGRATSLVIVSVIGLIGGCGLLVLAVATQSWWMGLIAVFIALRSGAGFQQARLIRERLALPRHTDLACPHCKEPPFKGDFWGCDQCETRFDTFAHRGVCPRCAARFDETACPECGRHSPIGEWFPSGTPTPRDERPA
ncbi:MAG: site-2 protease family protein [Gemmataceae bacterium]|nr:site-2 protease family protein [Gemmataceae bacterium]